MVSIKEDFTQRTQEIEQYFKFIQQTSIANSCVGNLYNDDIVPVKITDDLKKILKANLFILLYNLVESSFKKTLTKLIAEINDSQSTFGILIPEIRKVWLEDETKYFSVPAPKINGKTGIKLDHYYSIIEDICEHILTIPETPKISGNLDEQSIRKLSAKYGVLLQTLERIKAEKLRIVKDKRNDLAHGDITFLECGQVETPESLENIKNQVITFMKAILDEFDIYIQTKSYKIPA